MAIENQGRQIPRVKGVDKPTILLTDLEGEEFGRLVRDELGDTFKVSRDAAIERVRQRRKRTLVSKFARRLLPRREAGRIAAEQESIQTENELHAIKLVGTYNLDFDRSQSNTADSFLIVGTTKDGKSVRISKKSDSNEYYKYNYDLRIDGKSLYIQEFTGLAGNIWEKRDVIETLYSTLQEVDDEREHGPGVVSEYLEYRHERTDPNVPSFRTGRVRVHCDPADPSQIVFIFPTKDNKRNRWYVDRDVVQAGLATREGRYVSNEDREEVRVGTSPYSENLILVQSTDENDRSLTLELDRNALSKFLRRTTRAVQEVTV